MGAPLHRRWRLAEVEQLALKLLRKVGVRMLAIGELHIILAGNGPARRECLDLPPFLGNEPRIAMMGVGTREDCLGIRVDDQLENRFEPVTLPLWEPDDACCPLLTSFAASLPLGAVWTPAASPGVPGD